MDATESRPLTAVPSTAPAPMFARPPPMPTSPMARAKLPNTTLPTDPNTTTRAASRAARHPVQPGHKGTDSLKKKSTNPVPSPITPAFWLLLAAFIVLLIMVIIFIYQYIDLQHKRDTADNFRNDVLYTSDNIPIPNHLVVLDTLQPLFKMRETALTIDPEANDALLGVRTLTTSYDLITDTVSGASTRVTTLHADDYQFPVYRLNDVPRILTSFATPDTTLAWTALPGVTANSWGTLTGGTLGYSLPSGGGNTGSNGPVLVNYTSFNPAGRGVGSISVVTGTAPTPLNSYQALTGFDASSAHRVVYQYVYNYSPIGPPYEANANAQLLLATDSSYSDPTFSTPPASPIDAGSNISTVYYYHDSASADIASFQIVHRTVVLEPGMLQPTDYLSLWYQDRTAFKAVSVIAASLQVEELTTT